MKPSLTPNAVIVLQKRYLRKNRFGRVSETPEEMFARVAKSVASAEKLYKKGVNAKKTEGEFLDLMTRLEFLPNSPTLMNAGLRLGQLAACFVLPVEDSIESIFEAVKNTAIIHQSGGGTGFSFSRLRPSNDIVGSTGGLASGPVSFMRVFNAATEAIKQGGARRGANMGVLRIDHPDIIEFIEAKKNPEEFLNFNLSVAITNEFMKALAKNSHFPLVNPRDGTIVRRESAKKIFGLIIRCAWQSGEPGVIFMDRVNEKNPTPKLGAIEATNPCGEQPLLPYEPCNLGSINLGRMLKKTGTGWKINYDKLEKTVKTGVRFLDNVIDVNKYPVPEIERMAKGNRKIGLGVMGFADMLARLRMVYGSKESLKITEDIMSFINKTGHEASIELAKERGAFPNIKKSVLKKPIRNSTVTTIAPTGTLSLIAGCSSGIEPFYSLSFTRQVLEGTELPELNPIFEEVSKEEGFFSKDLMKYIERGGDIKKRNDVPEKFKKIFSTSFDISPEDHIKVQAAFQKHTDNAVSKTINLPFDATEDDVRKAYLLAYELGCKGVTIYRSGTREKQVLSCRNTLYC
ncbi:MAG: adenosylcobalamin-dependent ribonucleoside-diphosphate reductase [Thermodesulfobacteriota bacterium]